jgi:hypothetical protein
MTQPSKWRAVVRGFIARTTRFDSRFLLVLTTVVAIGVLWWKDRQQLEKRLAVLEGRLNPRPSIGMSWGLEQATGPPNTRTPGDQPTAWASQTPDSQPEWLEVLYAKAVKPDQIDVHETYNPGAVYKITAFDQFGNEGTLWEGTDPTPPNSGMGVSSFTIKNGFSTDRVRIYLASDKVPGWNEIDAVGLKYGWLGRVIWADKAKASSTYGGGGGMFGGGPAPNYGLSR